jgi:hypothetical protein
MKMTNLFGKILLVGIILSCQTGSAQTSMSMVAGLQNAPREKAIKAWYTAFLDKDWNLMQTVLADGFTFSSPLDDHINVMAFKERCWPNAYKIKGIDVTMVVQNGDDVYVTGNGWTTEGKFFRNTDYFKLKDGKISSYECFFGPGVNYPNSGK